MSVESEDDLVRFLVALVSERTSLADDHERIINTESTRRVARSASVRRTGWLQLQELSKRARRRRAVAPQARPPSLETRSIAGLRRSERGHPYGFAVPRVLEQHAEITIFDLAKDKPSRRRPQSR
jgi:hypothetical protein